MIKKLMVAAFIVFSIAVYAQEDPIIPVNGTSGLLQGFRPLTSDEISQIPELEIKTKRRSSLPWKLNNTTNRYFRGIVLQSGGSCAQTSGVAYIFTYEINFLRGLSSNDSANLYPSHFTYNFLNSGSDENGSNYTDGWQIIKEMGCPNLLDYGGLYPLGDKGWMTGYEKYLNAMNNRTLEYYRIDVGTEAGLNQLKQWLFDHGQGDEVGGLANFSAGIADATNRILPIRGYEGGKRAIIEWSDPVDHAMTFVGYDDSIRWDYNDDDQFTNDIDINEDGVVDMKDWEIGAMVVANTWGYNWSGGDSGLFYCPYRLLALDLTEGGISNSQVYVIKTKESYSPKVTAKLRIQHEMRGQLTITAGMAEYVYADKPDFEMTFTALSEKGGDYPMQGNNSDPIELALDLTPLVNKHNFEAFKYFIKIVETNEDTTSLGKVIEFSIFDHRNGSKEYVCPDTNVEIPNQGTIMLAVEVNDNGLPPTNLKADIMDDTSAIISWRKPETNLTITHYNIYRNNQLYTNTNDTFLAEYHVPNGTSYKVKAVYGSALSAPSNTVFISGLKKYPVASSGYTLNFDGVDDCIDCGKKIELANHHFTIEFWARRSPETSNQFVIGHGRRNKTNYGLHIGFRSNKLMCGFWGNDVHTDDPYVDENWHHWAITYDTNTMKQTIYRDGEIAGERTATAHYQGTGTLYIGCMTNDRWFYNGQIDEVRIWNKVRSVDQIKRFMFRPVASDADGLMAYWKFDEKVDDVIYDQSDSNNTGTILNAADHSWEVSEAWKYRQIETIDDSVYTYPGYNFDQTDLNFNVSEQPNYGNISYDATSGEAIYLMQNEFYGYDSFSYTISDASHTVDYKIFIQGPLLHSSIQSASKDQPISIYPQPASDYFVIRLNEEIQIKRIELIDAQGRLVYKREGDEPLRSIQVDVSELPGGVYMLKLEGKDRHFTREVLILN